jgi:hypothetical protein
MSDRSCTIEHVWDDLARIFPDEKLKPYRDLCSDPNAGFEATRKSFADDVAGLATSDHDINRQSAKRRLILGHVLLAIFDALRNGRVDFVPLPRVLGQPWPVQETALLLWAAQHGTSDDRWHVATSGALPEQHS